MREEPERRFRVVPQKVEVIRVEVQTVAVEKGYRRVELVIDGTEHEMSAPDAQILGQSLNRAAGGPSFRPGNSPTADSEES